MRKAKKTKCEREKERKKVIVIHILLFLSEPVSGAGPA